MRETGDLATVVSASVPVHVRVLLERMAEDESRSLSAEIREALRNDVQTSAQHPTREEANAVHLPPSSVGALVECALLLTCGQDVGDRKRLRLPVPRATSCVDSGSRITRQRTRSRTICCAAEHAASRLDRAYDDLRGICLSAPSRVGRLTVYDLDRPLRPARLRRVLETHAVATLAASSPRTSSSPKGDGDRLRRRARGRDRQPAHRARAPFAGGGCRGEGVRATPTPPGALRGSWPDPSSPPHSSGSCAPSRAS